MIYANYTLFFFTFVFLSLPAQIWYAARISLDRVPGDRHQNAIVPNCLVQPRSDLFHSLVLSDHFGTLGLYSAVADSVQLPIQLCRFVGQSICCTVHFTHRYCCIGHLCDSLSSLVAQTQLETLAQYPILYGSLSRSDLSN